MLIRLRAALMWMLLFAVPFQGHAAATMLHCGPNHHRVPATAVVEAAPVQPASAESRVHDGSADHHQRHEKHQDTVSKCSACAACCLGAALPTSALVFVGPLAVGMPASFFSMGPIGFLTDGPDRPPRTFVL